MGTISYGDEFGRRFGAEAAPALVSRSLLKTEIAVTYLNQEIPTFELSEPQPRQEAYLVSMGFHDFPGYSFWENGRAVRTAPVIAPQITFYDLRAAPYIYVNNPLVGLHFHIPHAAFDALADRSGVPRIKELHYPHGWGVDDPVVYHLGMALMPAFRHPEHASKLFVDHVTLAVSAHVAQTYGEMRTVAPKHGGLAPWQERLAKDILDTNLEGDVSHAWIAEQLGLSPSHFARAFRVSAGMAPHQWLLHRRVEKAKSLLGDGREKLPSIAVRCGFADQSHFTRVFSKLTGVTPGAWRRMTRG